MPGGQVGGIQFYDVGLGSHLPPCGLWVLLLFGEPVRCAMRNLTKSLTSRKVPLGPVPNTDRPGSPSNVQVNSPSTKPSSLNQISEKGSGPIPTHTPEGRRLTAAERLAIIKVRQAERDRL